MKKFFLLMVASLMTVFAMAKGDDSGSTKANAIEFDWDKGNVHLGGTKWYHVDLAPLYEEENPSLALYVTNPSRDLSVNADLKATVAGETETKHYVVSPHEHQTYTANATVLVRMHQTEIYLTLSTDGEVHLSAKVFESTDLDETCQDARVLTWDTEATQTKGYAAWWKVDISQFKDATLQKDAKVTITNIGSGPVNLKTGQSLDCPSSGLTKRNYTLAAGESVIDTIPQSMIASVYPDELYFWIENQEQPVKLKVEMVDQPIAPVIPSTGISWTDLSVTDTIEPLSAGIHYFRVKVSEMDSLNKYEPEFTYRNAGAGNATVSVKMAFELPSYGTSNTEYNLAPGEEEIVVYKKNMLEGMEGVEYIYLVTEVTGDVNFYGRFKHVREGKACKTNIDFNWESGHRQEAGTTQWYAVDVAEARDNLQDIVVHVQNFGAEAATLKAMVAFSCPYIDLQEITRTVAAGSTAPERAINYSMYAAMTDTVWIGLETSQDIKFWATKRPTKINEQPDDACLSANLFDWVDGVQQGANDTVWYKIAMDEARKQSAKFPTVFVQNLSATNELKVEAELSLECPDSIENEKRSLTIEANGSYSRQISRNMFENIVQDTVYVRVVSSQPVKLQIRMTEEAEGASCASAIPFNWVSGNTQAANANLWYAVDLSDVINDGNDIRLHIENRDNKAGKGVAQLVFSCPVEEAPSVQEFSLAANAERNITVQNSAFEVLDNSTVYVNLQGTTGLRIWAEKLPVEPFETITGEGLTLIPLKWDSLYEQDVDTAWYIITKEEIDKVRNADQKLKPVAHLINLGSTMNTIKAEAAYAFPIVKKMMTKSQALQAGQHYSDTVPASTFEQIIGTKTNPKKDTIIIRVTRPVGTANFQFKAELVKAFGGNSRYDALPVRMGEAYGQSANTEMWYKVKTADLKADKTLFNRSLHVIAKNAGAGETTVKVAVYEGLLSETDLFEEYAIDEKYRDRTLKKGETRSHNVPAQAIYAVGDLELYIKVRTTDSIYFSNQFAGTYAPAPVDPNQKDAQMIVPNVDYEIPGDSLEHWYLVCLPYIQNNYIYTDSSSLTYELNDTATIEVTATFQDDMDCQMPVRKRTINNRKGTKPLSELVNKALEKAGMKYDVTSFQDKFVDSLLHKFITKDSITGYVRIKTDQTIKFRINTPQVRGLKDCLADPMFFDWEHGNVNPAGQHTWYVAMLDSTKIPADKDLRIHLDNWSQTETSTATAALYFKCGDPEQGHITKTIAPMNGEWKDIARDFIANAGWPSMLFLDYQSDKTTHLWIELVDQQPRDTVRTDTTFFVCAGESIIGKEHTVLVMKDTVWNDTILDIKDETKAALYDSISTVHAYVLRDPKLYDFASQLSIKKGEVLDLSAVTAWLEAQYAADDNDTLKDVTAITWQYSLDGVTYEDIPATPLPYARINLQYTAELQCDGAIEMTYMNTVRDTLYDTFCKTYTWEGYTYKKDTLDSVTYAGGLYRGDSIAYLSLTKLPVALGDTTVSDVCKSFTWHGVTYDKDTTAIDTLVGAAANGCDSIVTLHLTLLPSVKSPISFDTCNLYTWHGVTYYTDTIVSDTLIGGAYNGCDSIVTLTLTINKPYIFTLPMVAKYGDRLLMIDRNKIVAIPGWENLPDSVDTEGYVIWWKEGETESIGSGYYYTQSNGEPLAAGTYYATISLPAADGTPCGVKGETDHYAILAAAPAPALVPTLARPGENISVINLDPNKTTTIRLYTTEGLLQKSFVVSGETTFVIKAADAHGFYLVELSNESLKTTLRYIVK